MAMQSIMTKKVRGHFFAAGRRDQGFLFPSFKDSLSLLAPNLLNAPHRVFIVALFLQSP
jgi:hypothetical protein